MWMLISALEFLAIVLLVWGFANEDNFISLEQKVVNRFRLALLRNRRFVEWLNKPSEMLCEALQDDFTDKQ